MLGVPMILHCCMAMGRLHVPFMEACLGDRYKGNGEAVQRVLYGARTSVRLRSSAAADGEKAGALFLTPEDIGPLVAFATADADWQAVVAMQYLVGGLVLEYPTSLRPTRRRGRAGLPSALLQDHLPIELPLLLGGGCYIGDG